jgi:ABC-type transporter Mla subunit MlaD
VLDNARSIKERVNSLSALIDDVEVAERRIPALEAHLASLPEPEDLDALIQAYVDARKRIARYTESIKVISEAQRGVQRAEADLVSADEDLTAAVDQVRTAMAGIAQGFESFMREHMSLARSEEPDLIDVREAAILAARYVAQLDG